MIVPEVFNVNVGQPRSIFNEPSTAQQLDNARSSAAHSTCGAAAAAPGGAGGSGGGLAAGPPEAAHGSAADGGEGVGEVPHAAVAAAAAGMGAARATGTGTGYSIGRHKWHRENQIKWHYQITR